MTQPTASAADQMLQMIVNFWTTRAVFAAAKLGIADHIHDTPLTAADLAARTKTHAPSLFRLLRALASVGVFTEDEQQRFSTTELGATLRTGVPGSLRASMISELGEDHYDAWADILGSVATGEIAFDRRFGMPVWRYYAEKPEAGAVFNESMVGLTRSVEAAVVRAYDFSSCKAVVDVGGGFGGLLFSVLDANPNLKGILFDAPEVIEGSRRRIAAEGRSDRCEAVGGDFFTSVPSGVDLYMLKWIIHDWDDEKSRTILTNCRRAMNAGARLVLIDSVVPGRNEPSFSKFMDLNMLVMTGGRERSAEEFRDLLTATGFRLTRILPTQSIVSIVEAEPSD
jgi:hypothetical protein